MGASFGEGQSQPRPPPLILASANHRFEVTGQSRFTVRARPQEATYIRKSRVNGGLFVGQPRDQFRRRLQAEKTPGRLLRRERMLGDRQGRARPSLQFARGPSPHQLARRRLS